MLAHASKNTNDGNMSSRYHAGTMHANEPLESPINSPFSAPIIQRKAVCSCGGGCPSCQAYSGSLKVSQPNDPAEIEADQIADRVMRMPVSDAKPKANLSNSSDAIHRKCDACEEEEDEVAEKPVMRKEAFASAAPAPPPDGTPPTIRNVINSGGQPLDLETRSFFEPRFGTDFGHVRIHSGTKAAESARSVNALAFTSGRDIVFGAGRFAPDTNEGRRLIAHELTHVVQQSGSGEISVSPGSEKLGSSLISASKASIQRQHASSDAATEPAEEVTVSGLIVDDTTAERQSGQMRRSEFLAELRAEICRTAEEAMAGTESSTADCPYLDFWFSYYGRQSSQHIERAIRRYASETASVESARDFIPLIAERARQAIATWLSTGRITGVPTELSTDQADEVSEESRGTNPVGGIQFKSLVGGPKNVNSPQAIRSQLGSGHALDSGVRSNMESAYGRSFSEVRVHTDSKAASLTDGMNARAFTIGQHIAFGSSEYRPGSLIGDAIIAHELAHVIQQDSSGGNIDQVSGPQGNDDQFEEDADQAAMAATLSFWGRTKRVLNGITQEVKPLLKSGLQLRTCRRTVRQCPRGLRWAVVGEPAATGPVCVCAWRCMPPGTGYSLSSGSGRSSGPTITCANPDRFGRCPGDPTYVTVDEDYEVRNQGTVVGVGAHMSPLGAQAACGCLPLDIEGDPSGETEVHAPLLPPGIDITDILGPGAEVVTGRRAADPRTGVRTPERDEPTRPRPSAPMTPPPSHVGSPSETAQPPRPRPATPAPAPVVPHPAAPTPDSPPAHVPGTTDGPAAVGPTAIIGPAAPTRAPGEGITVRGRVSWGNPASRPAYGHSLSEHGPRRPGRELQDRANTTGDPQGHFSDARFIVEAEQRAPLSPGAHDVPMGQPVGRVYMPNASPIENVTTVRVVRKPDLTVRTSFPINP